MRPMLSRLVTLASLMATCPLLASRAGDTGPPVAKPKVLIEFGWDEPDPAFLRRHVAMMERTPFDGCVFHVSARDAKGQSDSFTWNFWSRRTFTDAELAPALDDLKATRPTRFRHNFLRINTTPGDLDWFDDYGAIVSNARLAARFAREGGCPGVLFDIEQYIKPLFQYSKQSRRDTKSWDEYAAQVRKRGQEVMNALQEGYPGLTVLSTFGPSLVHSQTNGGKRPIKDASYGLLVPLLQGMSDARRGATRFVDGYELSYSYKEPRRYEEAAATIRKLDPKMEVGFGIWLDQDWRRKGWNAKDPSKNYFTPESFETAVRAALERCDEIVWIYTETPQWWSQPDGHAVKLPDAYAEALRRARRGLAAD